MFECINVAATPLPWNDTYEAIRSGVVDGAETNIEGYINFSIYEVAPNVAMVNHMYTCECAVMSEEKYQSLTDTQKKILDEAFREIENWFRGASLYLVLKSNGLRHSKNLPEKFGFSSKSVPANIAKKLPLQLRPKPLFIAFFNFSHKRPTFALTPESGYTLGSLRKIAHSGLHDETGAFPPSATAGLCAACEIAPITAFATLDSAVLL